MNNKFRSLLIAALFAIGVTASGAAAVAAHQAQDSGGAIQLEPAQANDTDNLQQGETGQVGESVNENKDDGQKGETDETGESVNDNKDQKDVDNHDNAQQGQSGDQK